MFIVKRHGSAVGIATGYGLDRGVGVRVLTFPCRLDRLWGPSYTIGTGGFFPPG
jgi:hypothetical protein